MKLSDVKQHLSELNEVVFKLPNGEKVAPHFHVTEIGLIKKHFIDCGGTIRNESVISFQLFTANDYDHRLSASKLKSIIELSEKHLGLDDLDVEVEYQAGTIGKFGLNFDGIHFVLTNKFTNCLAKDNCGIPTSKPNVKLSEINKETACCTPGGGCC